jgi:multidrug resistance efflux pump
MSKLPPIPTPLSARWRDFRLRLLPFVIFGGGLAVLGLFWNYHTRQATLQGIGESVRATVNTAQTVRVLEWLVPPHTLVTAGTPVVVVAPADFRAEFNQLSSQLGLARLRSQASLAQDNAMNYERIRIELLKTKSELAIARIKLEQAERDVARNTPLFREKLVAQDLYELGLNTRDALKAEVEEKGRAVAQIEARLVHLRPIGEPEAAPRDEAAQVLAQLEEAQEAAARNLQPQILVAPIDGMLSLPFRQVGEAVPAGEPLASIDAVRADKVVAYLRQPYRFDPEVGMAVHVTTRTFQRQAFRSHIMQIGAQVEVLTNALAVYRPGNQVDAALPVFVPIPREINIRPGEVVDVIITKSSDPSELPAAQVRPAAPQL